MSINIIDNFSVNVAKPLDAKIIASGSSARWAIAYKYDGLKVFDTSDRKTYVWDISSATWSVDHQILMGDGYVPKYQLSFYGFTNSVIYSTGSNVGINTIVPKSSLQINDSLGFAQPINFSFLGVDSRISTNWYYDGSDQVHNIAKGSSIIVFNDDHFTVRVREANDLANSFSTPLSLSRRQLDIITDIISATGGTISLTGTHSINLITDGVIDSTGAYGYVYMSNYSQKTTFESFIPDNVTGGWGTFSITTNNGSYPTGILVESSSSILKGADVTIKSGTGLVFKSSPANGGKINIIAGAGAASTGKGGSVSISSGGVTNVLGIPGDISLTPGYNGATYGNIYFGINRMKITDNDIYAWVHQKGTNGIGDSGNSVAPWGYPSLASGQFTLSSGDFTSNVNCSAPNVRPAAWHRTGNIVTVSGQVSFTVTTANTDTSFKLKIPITSTFGVDSGGGDGNNWQLSGVGKIVSKYGSTGDVVTIQAYATGKADFKFKPSSSGTQNMVYHYTYILGSWPDTAGGGGGGGPIG